MWNNFFQINRHCKRVFLSFLIVLILFTNIAPLPIYAQSVSTNPAVSAIPSPSEAPSISPTPSQTVGVTPTLFCLGSCPTLEPAGGVIAAPVVVTPTPVISQVVSANPVQDPCATVNAVRGPVRGVATLHRGDLHNGMISQAVNAVLNLIIQLFKLILGFLFGLFGAPPPLPTPTPVTIPTPTPLSIPGTTVVPITAGPTENPCLNPTATPVATVPTAVVVTPTPTPAVSPFVSEAPTIPVSAAPTAIVVTATPTPVPGVPVTPTNVPCATVATTNTLRVANHFHNGLISQFALFIMRIFLGFFQIILNLLGLGNLITVPPPAPLPTVAPLPTAIPPTPIIATATPMPVPTGIIVTATPTPIVVTATPTAIPTPTMIPCPTATPFVATATPIVATPTPTPFVATATPIIATPTYAPTSAPYSTAYPSPYSTPYSTPYYGPSTAPYAPTYGPTYGPSYAPTTAPVLPSTMIYPSGYVGPTVTPGPVAGIMSVANTLNWAGYISSAAVPTNGGVSTSWTIVKVDCSAGDGQSGPWVGEGGWVAPDSNIAQVGNAYVCQGGKDSYSAWTAKSPDAPVTLPNPVKVGDQMTASILFQGNGAFMTTLSDITQGWTVSTPMQFDPSYVPQSREIVFESTFLSALVLKFDDETFTNTVYLPNQTQQLQFDTAPGLTKVETSANNTQLVSVGPISGGNFTVHWLHN